MESGTIDNICTTSKYGYYNKLYNHRYIKFNIDGGGLHRFIVNTAGGDRFRP